MNTLYKNISLTLYSRKGWCWLCVRGELETGTDCCILSQVLLTIAALLSHIGWGCSTVTLWGPKALCQPLALISASCPQLTPTVSSRCPLVILLFNAHLFPLFFRLFTQVYLLTDGSAKGQYVTVCSFKIIMEFLRWNVLIIQNILQHQNTFSLLYS